MHTRLLPVGFLMAAFFAISCSEELTFLSPTQLEPLSLSGQISQENITRANDYGFVTGDRMGIYVVDCINGQSSELGASDNRASNVHYTFDGDTYRWTTPASIYWRDQQTPIDIYGYYPAVNYIELPTAYHFSVQADQSTEAQNGDLSGYEQSDLLWGKATNIAYTTDQIVVQFHHILAGVRVHLNKGEGMSDAEWQKLDKIVLVENIRPAATINLSDGSVVADVQSSPTPIRMSPQSGSEYRAVVIPQAVASGKQLISITLDGQTYSHQLSSTMTYEAGKLHNFTLTVNKREATGGYQLSLAYDGITPWMNDEISHQFSANAYVTVHCAGPGKLEQSIRAAGYDPQAVVNLKVTGTVNADDYHLLASSMPELRHLNLREAVSRHVFVGHNWDTDEDYYEDNVFTGFYGNKSIRSLLIPSSTKKIHNDAFREMRLMYSTLEIPEGVTKIGGTAFAYNEYNGVELVLPATLDTIEGGAFTSCQYKCELKLTDNIRYIGEDAFGGYGEGCPNFYGVFHIPSHLAEVHRGMMGRLGRDGSFTGELEIPQGLTEIPNNAFCVSLKHRVPLTIPEGVKRIGTQPFPALCSIHFNSDLEEIGDAAFYNSGLYFPIELPSQLRIIGESAFLEARLEGEIVIPENCLTIGQSAFSNNEITRITFPSKLESIANRTCSSCPYLREVTIPKYVDYIGDYAFGGCPAMQTIVCLSPEPPGLGRNVFTRENDWEDGMAMDKVILQVPEASIEAYRHAEGWSDFKNITPYRELAFNIPEIFTLDKGNTLQGILRAEGAWEVSDCPNWVTVTPASGTGKEEVTVKVHAVSGNTAREGHIVFRLKDKDYTYYTTVRQVSSSEYTEDKAYVLQRASAGAANAIPIFLVGEGYDGEEIASGQYLEDMRQQMEHLFSCEPYKTYRTYFTVSTALACSPESGLGGRTRFASGIDAFSGTFYTDQWQVWEYAAAHGEAMNHGRATVVMVMNTSQTLNTVLLDDDGYSLALIGKSTDIYPYEQRELVLRDVGGRAFGHLATEAVNHFTFIKSCTCPNCRSWVEYSRGKQLGWYENISLSGKMNEAPWAHLIFDERYSSYVDMFEGGYNHARGVYSSENMSVMGNVPIPYFNAISRESIVKRIMQYAGETYSFEKFAAKDKREYPDE